MPDEVQLPEEAPVSLYVDLEEGQRVDLEIIGRAAIAFASAGQQYPHRPTAGDDSIAPIPAVRLTTIDLLKSTGETEPRESDVVITVRARLTPKPLIS
jgi:hypothetical protein